MAAKNRRDERGQSLIEFLLMLPLMVGFAFVLIRSNTAIQISIVDQKYARQQALFLAFNSATYPAKPPSNSADLKKGFDQMVLGVGDLTFKDDNGDPTDTALPYASVQNVARKGPTPQSTDSASVGTNVVHIRDTVTLCTQNHPEYNATLTDNSTFTFCKHGGSWSYE